MEQNTAPNSSPQFPYPDFSGNGQGQAAAQPVQDQSQGQQQNDDSKIDELRKSLDSLMNQEASANKQQENQAEPEVVAQQPAPAQVEEAESVSSPPSPQQPQPQQPQQPPPQQQQSPPSQADELAPVPPHTEPQVDSYVQEPKPLPAMDAKLPDEEVADVSTKVTPPSGDGFAPLPSDLPQFNDTLDNIMPESIKKAQPEVTQDDQQEQDTPPPGQEQPQQENDQTDTESFTDPEAITAEKLMGEAIARGASDLHLTVGYPPILRIDGELINLGEYILTPEDTERLVFSVLTDEKKELLEVNREVDFAYTHKGGVNSRFRINAFYTMKNLSAAFRLIPSRVKTIEELKLPQLYNQFAKLKQGLVLVTGPTGHGKSTTIAAILEAINRTRFCHIVTIEDPIEYVFEGKRSLIDQREMNDDTHSWKVALRSALRQDPDVILVGEMRDFETIEAAITLAETGHLVFGTLHTNSAAQTINRIIDVFPEAQQQQVRTQIANTLQVVIAQRLIPLDNGGRRAVSEIMLNTSAIKNLIREGKVHQIDNVIRTSSDLGMVYLEKSLVNLVREGAISVQKAQEYAVHPEEVLRLLKE